MACLFFKMILFLAIGFKYFEGPGPETQSSNSAISHYKETQKPHKMDFFGSYTVPLKGYGNVKTLKWPSYSKHAVVQSVQFFSLIPKTNSKGVGA